MAAMAAKLFEQHRQLIAMAEELLTLVRREPCVSIEEIALARARLGRLGIAHLQAEDELIVQPLLTSGRACELPDAEAIIEDIRETRRISAEYAGRWTMAAVEADRDGYAAALDEMVAFIREVTAREEEQLYRPVIALLRHDAACRVH
jgi:hypothetical protein